MPLYPVQFIDGNDIFKLLTKLEELNHIKLVQKDHGNKKVQTHVNSLAQQLLVANDGNTYLLDDILHASEEEKQSSSLTFLARNHIHFRLYELDEELYEQLIHNYILAQMLSSIIFKPENKLYIKLNLPIVSPTNFFTIIFPVITPCEISYDRYDIEGWLQYRLSKNQPYDYPIALDNQYESSLTPDSLIRNIATEQLIWIYLQLSQKRRLLYGDEHSGLKQLIKLNDHYELSLLHKKYSLEALFSPEFKLKSEGYEKALAQFPRYKNAEYSSIFKRKAAIKNQIYFVDQCFQISSILSPMFSVFSLAFFVGSNDYHIHELDLIKFFDSFQKCMYLMTILALFSNLFLHRLKRESERELTAVNTIYMYKRLGYERIYDYKEYQKRDEEITSRLEEVTALKQADASKLNQETGQSLVSGNNSLSPMRFFHSPKLASQEGQNSSYLHGQDGSSQVLGS